MTVMSLVKSQQIDALYRFGVQSMHLLLAWQHDYAKSETWSGVPDDGCA